MDNFEDENTLYNNNSNKSIIMDLDGTLADGDYWAKKIFLEGEGDMITYQARMMGFPVREHIGDLVKMYADNNRLINIVSARPEYLIDMSKYWLEKNGLPYNNIYHKPSKSKQDVAEWKYDVIKKIDNVEIVFDDNPKVIKYLQDKGYNTFFVNSLYKW